MASYIERLYKCRRRYPITYFLTVFSDFEPLHWVLFLILFRAPRPDSWNRELGLVRCLIVPLCIWNVTANSNAIVLCALHMQLQN